MTDDENARYRRAIRAAEELFKRVGFRAVTMEEVAREANVAKATLYSFFRNKDELYLAVCQRIARLLRGAVEQALASGGTSLDARLECAIIAKHRLVFTQELLSFKDATAQEIFTQLDTQILQLLSEAMRADRRLTGEAPQLARALYFGSSDLARHCNSAEDMEREIASFATTLLTGARALARRTSRRIAGQ
jgi:AcrR family transcriptional regulator